jgi:hypothetical protein
MHADAAVNDERTLSSTNRPGSSDWPSPRVAAAVVVTLAAFHFAAAWDVLRRATPTVDEIAHLPAGVSYLDQGDLKMYRHSPPLARVLAASAARGALRTVYDRSWARDEPANHWRFAFETLAAHSESPEARGSYLDAFTRARTVMAAWSALTIPVLYAWGAWWYGRSAGLLAAALWAMCPNMIAHAGVVGTDLPAASMGLISAFLFARWLDRSSWRRALAAGVALGLTQLVKFSALTLYPAFVVWAVVHYAFRRDRRESLGRVALQFAAVVALSVAVVNQAYRWEGAFTGLGRFPFVSDALTKPRTSPGGPLMRTNNLAYQRIGAQRVNRFWETPLQDVPCPLPYHFVAGFDEQKLESEGKYAMYLRGRFARPLPDPGGQAPGDASESGRRGWWYYYLYALGVKTPIGTLALLGAASWLALRRPTARTTAPVLFLAAVPIATMSFMTDINLGLRYVLPALPFLFLFAGTVVAVGRPRWRRALAAAALAWNGTSLVRIHPHELEYFNETVGGPSNGRFHLIDSNLDWGQGLRGLSRWLESNPDWKESVRLAYFGSVPPEFEGIENYRLAPRDLRFVPPDRRMPGEQISDASSWGPLPGKYAVSVNFERGMRFHTPCPIDEFIARRGRLGGALLGGSQMLEIPRGAYSYFQHLRPRIEPEIGYSILLYDVSLEDANRVRANLGLPLLPSGPIPAERTSG